MQADTVAAVESDVSTSPATSESLLPEERFQDGHVDEKSNVAQPELENEGVQPSLRENDTSEEEASQNSFEKEPQFALDKKGATDLKLKFGEIRFDKV